MEPNTKLYEMSENKKSFVKDLDQLIELLKKLKEKFGNDSHKNIDQSFFDNFEQILSNYNYIKDDVSEKLLNQFGEPIQHLVSQMIKELKVELDESEYQNDNIQMDLNRIDQLLTSPEIRDDEINRLLDRRSELLAIKSGQITRYDN